MRDTSTPPGGPPTFKQRRRQQPPGSRHLARYFVVQSPGGNGTASPGLSSAATIACTAVSLGRPVWSTVSPAHTLCTVRLRAPSRWAELGGSTTLSWGVQIDT